MTEEQSAKIRRIERGKLLLDDILPDAAVLDENERESLLLVLYDTKILDEILKADADSIIIETFHEQLKIDPSTGRITYLKLDRTGVELGDSNPRYSFKVPPSIRLLKNLVGISLFNCTGLSIELNNLPLLEKIEFTQCGRELFGTIPEGLQLPKVKKLEMTDFELGNHYQLFNSFSGIIEEIYLGFFFWDGDGEQNRLECQHVFDALKKNEGLSGLRHTLKKVTMDDCGLNNTDFRGYVVEFRRLYPNLRELDLSGGNSDIDSFKGIAEDIRKEYDDGNGTIQDDTQLINTNLRKLILPNNINDNDVAYVIDFLHIFQGITHLRGYLSLYHRALYHPTVEHMLRENTMRVCLSEGVLSKKMPSVLALWPFILHKVHNDSVKELYQLQYDIDHWDENIERRNNSTTDEDEEEAEDREVPFEPKREDYSCDEEYNYYMERYFEPWRKDYSCDEEYDFYMKKYHDETRAYFEHFGERYDPAKAKRQYSALIESKKDASVVYELLRRNATAPPFTNILLQRTHNKHDTKHENEKGERNGDKN